MFERFTERSRRALFDSRHSAFLAGFSVIEGHRLLYALIASEDLLVLSLLRHAQVSADRVLSAMPSVPSAPAAPQRRSAFTRLERFLGIQRRVHNPEIPFDDELKRVLKFAEEEADGMHHAKIWTGHLLLGLLREELSAGRGPLMQSGMSIEAGRITVRESI